MIKCDYFRWTLPHLTEKRRRELQILLGVLEQQGMVDIVYRDYNWNLNKL